MVVEISPIRDTWLATWTGWSKIRSLVPTSQVNFPFVWTWDIYLPWYAFKTHLHTLLIFLLQKLQVFTVSQIPLQFHWIFYRQPTVNIFLQFLHSIFALVVCKKCSETAVGFVTQWKPVPPLQISTSHYDLSTTVKLSRQQLKTAVGVNSKTTNIHFRQLYVWL